MFIHGCAVPPATISRRPLHNMSILNPPQLFWSTTKPPSQHQTRITNYFFANLKFFWANLKLFLCESQIFLYVFCKSQIFLYAFCESQIFWNAFKIFYKIEKPIKILIAIFHQIWNENWFLTTKFALSEPLRTLKRKNIDRQQYYVDKPVPKSKSILTIFIFFQCLATLLTLPIDRSRSQLLRTFFLASLRFL